MLVRLKVSARRKNINSRLHKTNDAKGDRALQNHMLEGLGVVDYGSQHFSYCHSDKYTAVHSTIVMNDVKF